MAVRGRIICVFEVYLHVYRGRDGGVCVCVCVYSHICTCVHVIVCDIDVL